MERRLDDGGPAELVVEIRSTTSAGRRAKDDDRVDVVQVVVVHEVRTSRAVGDVVSAVLDVLGAGGGGRSAAVTPIRTWRRAAEAIGVSVDTLRRQRKQHGVVELRPYFPSAQAAVDWYRALGATRELPQSPTRARRSRRRSSGLTLASVRKTAVDGSSG